MTYEDVQEVREEGGFCPSCGEHKERGRECLCCGWVKAPPDYAVKCDVVEVEALRARIAQIEPVYEAAMRGPHSDLPRHVSYVIEQLGWVQCAACCGNGGDCDAGDDGQTVSWVCKECGGTGRVRAAREAEEVNDGE